MDVVICYCLQCKSELGRFRNSWNGIGNTYFSPVHPPVSLSGLESTGDVYQAASGSQIENSFLQDVACVKCQTVLGLKCDNAPEDHLLKPDQLILRLVAMSLISEGSGEKAKISILKTFPLTTASSKKASSFRRSSTALPSPRPQTPSLNARTPATPSLSRRPSMVPESAPPSPTELQRFKIWAEESMKSQQKDIDRISGAVDRIENQMNDFRNFMAEIQTELKSNRENQEKQRDEDVVSMHEEINKSRNQTPTTTKAHELNGSTIFLKNRLEAIADDVLRVGQKSAEVDVLKKGLEQMRNKLAEFEQAASEKAAEHIAVSAAELQQRRNESIDQDLNPSAKRNHGRITHQQTPLEEDSSPQLPTKRRRIRYESTGIAAETTKSSGSRTRRSQPKEQMIEILSSEDEILTPITRRNVREHDDIENGDAAYYPHTDPLSPVNSMKHLSGNVLRASVSAPNLRAVSMDPRAQREGTYLDEDGKLRIGDGVLLTVTGKIDRRSFRYNKERAASIAPIAQFSAKSPNKPNNTPSGENQAIFPTVERSERDVFMTPGHLVRVSDGNQSSGPGKLFKCGTCGKRYSHSSTLEYHHAHSDCEPSPKDLTKFLCSCGKQYKTSRYYERHILICETHLLNQTDATETELQQSGRLAALAARERLVRATLEREMSGY